MGEYAVAEPCVAVLQKLTCQFYSVLTTEKQVSSINVLIVLCNVYL